MADENGSVGSLSYDDDFDGCLHLSMSEIDGNSSDSDENNIPLWHSHCVCGQWIMTTIFRFPGYVSMTACQSSPLARGFHGKAWCAVTELTTQRRLWHCFADYSTMMFWTYLWHNFTSKQVCPGLFDQTPPELVTQGFLGQKMDSGSAGWDEGVCGYTYVDGNYQIPQYWNVFDHWHSDNLIHSTLKEKTSVHQSSSSEVVTEREKKHVWTSTMTLTIRVHIGQLCGSLLQLWLWFFFFEEIQKLVV